MKQAKTWLQTRGGGLAIRALALLLFTTLLYQVEYQRVARDDFAFNDFNRVRMTSAIRAANGGYPFYFYLGEGIDPGVVNTDVLYRWSNTSDDFGLYILVASSSVIGRQFDPDLMLNVDTPYRVLFALFTLTALVFLWPSVPLPLSLAGLGALSFGIFLGPMDFNTAAHNWGLPYTVLTCGMILASLPALKRTWGSAVYLMLLCLLAAYSPMFREESSTTVYMAILSLVALPWLIALVAYRVLPGREVWRRTALPLALRGTLAGGLLFVCLFGIPRVVQLIYAQAWDTPYSETRVSRHGVGLPLYLSTGYISNPYNITWIDLTGPIHAQLYDPEVDTRFDSPEFDHTLQAAWREVALESPWLLAENMWEKAKFVDYFMRERETPYPFPPEFLYIRQTASMVGLYYLMFVALLGGLGYLLYRGTPAGLWLFGGALAVSLGGSLGAVLIFPSYAAGVQGAILLLTLLMPVGVGWYGRREDWAGVPPEQLHRITRWTLILVLVVAGLGLLGVGIFTAIQWNATQSQLEEAAESDPFTALQEQGFAYGRLFNSLSAEEQQALIERLQTTEDPRIYQPADSSDEGYFRVEVAVRAGRQLHVIVWLGEGYPGGINPINQALVYSLVQVCVGCDTLAAQYGYNPSATLYTFLNESDWDNRYRLLSFPIGEDFPSEQPLLIGAQHILDWGGLATEFSYLVEDLASEQVRPYDTQSQ